MRADSEYESLPRFLQFGTFDLCFRREPRAAAKQVCRQVERPDRLTERPVDGLGQPNARTVLTQAAAHGLVRWRELEVFESFAAIEPMRLGDLAFRRSATHSFVRLIPPAAAQLVLECPEPLGVGR